MLDGLLRSHDAVYPRLEVHRRMEAFQTTSRRSKGATTVPNTAYLIAGNDLCEQTGRDMSHFDKAGVKEKDIRPVYCHALSCALPLNGACSATRYSVFVDVDAEF